MTDLGEIFILPQGPQHKIEIIAKLTSMDRSVAVPEHLKAIEIKCEVVGEEVHKVLKFLCSFNICKLTNDTLGALYISLVFLHMMDLETKNE
jgi:hypothetical protein